MKYFYNDRNDDTAARYVADLVYQAEPSFCTPLTYEAYRDVPTHYLFCKQDASISLASQQMLVAILGEGLVRTYQCDAGHCAMLSAPQAVADVIQVAATENTS
jgi:pimeloyl-ACP methyl ester carboxylesterase